MENNRHTKLLFWNVRGINSQEKWDVIRGKIDESACQIVCIQETKRESFDQFYIKKFCPRSLDRFAFFPSVGASGGLLTVWNNSLFDGTLVQANSYAVTVKMLSRLENNSFHVTNIYGPSHSPEKLGFVTWLINLDTTEFEDWIIGGDFNLIRHPENRNKPGGDLGEMNMFNELITDLDLTEIPFSGRSFSWSNMQADPLLIKLDWVFTSSSWAMSFPATFVQPLSKPVSDHIPYAVIIRSSIPKSNMFRFENYWVDHPGFLETVELH
ncbi:uncharacterized protein [Miscanthus floridulus]|uniref:uncharacterized protein n=1 Tax=Miscanthus floridulus TaxID=154761 RepID=UPI00345A8258